MSDRPIEPQRNALIQATLAGFGVPRATPATRSIPGAPLPLPAATLGYRPPRSGPLEAVYGLRHSARTSR